MEAASSGYLDETSASQSIKSPIKTSTVIKENIKWNENDFFQRQASESLFLTATESPITASKESNVLKEIKPAYKFNLNDCSYASEESLGILHIENITDFSESSFQSTTSSKSKKSKRKLKRSSKVSSKDFLSVLKNGSVSKEILNNSKDETSKENHNDSSSDVEYDGTNIPELNMDCDILSLINSNRDHSSANDILHNGGGMEVGEASTRNITDFSENGSTSLFTQNEISTQELTNRDTFINNHESIFEKFSPNSESLYHQLLSNKENAVKEPSEKLPERIKVCPFLGMSSFEVEPILHRYCDDSSSPSIEATRFGQDLSADFCPEQISARSSSFKSSVKYDNTETPDISAAGVDSQYFEQNPFKMPHLEEGLENEVFSGSYFQTSGTELESQIEDNADAKEKGSGFGSKSCDSNTFSKSPSPKHSVFSDLPPQANFLDENSLDFAVESENLYSSLAVSESDFFSSDAAKEMLKKDTDEFEKEHMFESSSYKMSGVSDWSPPNEDKITPPSWFSELNSDQRLDPNRQISIGTLIGTRSENIGSLSDDPDRERPYFGTTVITPPKLVDTLDSTVTGSSTDGKSKALSPENLRESALSAIINDLSVMDSSTLASKIIERCKPTIKENSEKTSTDRTTTENIEYASLPEDHCEDVPTDTEESETTFVKSASNNNISSVTDVDADRKPESAEQSMNNCLNFTLGSASGRESIKTTKSDACSNCSAPASHNCASQEFSRPGSSCSSACGHPLSVRNAYCVQYPASENNFNGICNAVPAGASFPCPHVCSEHARQPNFLSCGASNSLQPMFQNTLQGPVFVLANPVSQITIQAPTELRFPEKIAVGDSQERDLTVRNTSGVACYYLVSCVSAYLNDYGLPVDMTGLSFNKTVPCSVDNVTDIKLLLAPKYEGKFEVRLQIDAFLNPAGQINLAPGATVITRIIYEVVRPSVSILYKGKDCLSMGAIVAGSSFVEHITVVNNCEVSIPLRITLSNDSLENQVSFGLKQMDRQRHPASVGPKFLSPRILLYRIPASKNKLLPSSLDIPIVFESINGAVSSTVTASVETPTLSENLAFIKISADVGEAKLSLKDANENPVTLKASKGATSSHNLTVVNYGTLPVTYDIHIDGDSGVLSVSPHSLDLQPKQSATLSVTFTPQTYDTARGKLLAAAEPHGQISTIAEIIGHVRENNFVPHRSSNPQVFNARPTRDSMDSANESSSFIECNKKDLLWGGCDIDTILLRTFTLRNPRNEPIRLKVFIKETGKKGFLLIDESSEKTTYYTLVLNAKEEKHLSVAFVPKNVEFYSATLCIKSADGQNRASVIKLSGYGGAAKIKVLGLPNIEGTGYCLEVSNSTDTVTKNITLHNAGSRPAFVKLLIIYGTLRPNLLEKQTVINPSEFVLMENEKKDISVTISCMNRNCILNNEVITIFYGDEILRQRLRKKLNTYPSMNDSTNINFNVPFDGEDRVHDSFVSSPKDEDLFHSYLRKLMIHIVFNGQNASFSRMSFCALSEVEGSLANLTLDSTVSENPNYVDAFRRMSIEGHSPPVRESSKSRTNRLSVVVPFDLEKTLTPVPSPSAIADELQNLRLVSWTVNPEELIIDAENKDKRIVLKSCSNVDVRFKVEWTIDVITVSPNSGILPANGEIGLRLTLINTNHTKLVGDYHGNIKILCDGSEKNVTVKVLKDHQRPRCPSPVHTVLNDSLRSSFLGDSYTLINDTTAESVSHVINVENIFSIPNVIHLQKTKQGVLSETTLVVNNPSRNTVAWSIRPFTMVFIEPSEDSVDTSRSVFGITMPNGTIKHSEANNIVIQFLPQCVAKFSQFFEFSFCLDDDDTKQTRNIKIQGEGVADLQFSSRESISSVTGTKTQATAVKKRVKSEIFIQNDECKFPSTNPGHKSTSAIIVKNISNRDNKVVISKPKLPFIINTTEFTIKSKKYLRIPIHFKPLKPGSFENEVKITCENGIELKLRLSGSCSM